MNTRNASIPAFCLSLTMIFFQSKTKNIDEMDWMSGCWSVTLENRVIEEQWMKPVGQTMIGMGRTISGGKTLFFEFLQITRTDTGIYYWARPRGNTPTPFRLVKSSKNEVIFENPKHDFPQRIIYRKQSKTSLFARVEATVKGELQFEEFPYHRGNCE